MKAILPCLLIVLLVPLATPVMGQEPGEPVPPPPERDAPEWDQPAPQPPPDAQPPDRQRDQPRRDKEHSRRAPSMRPPGQAGSPGMDRARRPDAPPLQPLLRMIHQHRPELAERLERLRKESPERFREVVLDAMIFRLEAALDEGEHPGGPPPGHPGPGREGQRMGPGQRRPHPAEQMHIRIREMEERHEHLEQQSHELAHHLREIREQQASKEDIERAHGKLAAVVNQQFDLRSELRRTELERVQRELEQLRRMVEKMERQLDRRAGERDVIIERRINQLLGEDFAGW